MHLEQEQEEQEEQEQEQEGPLLLLWEERPY
jgi:hypothetical protein